MMTDSVPVKDYEEYKKKLHIGGLAQDCSNSIVNALELRSLALSYPYESTITDDITTTKQSLTKLCVYSMGYSECINLLRLSDIYMHQ